MEKKCPSFLKKCPLFFLKKSVIFEERSLVFEDHAMGLTKEASFLLHFLPRALHTQHKIIIFAVDLL